MPGIRRNRFDKSLPPTKRRLTFSREGVNKFLSSATFDFSRSEFVAYNRVVKISTSRRYDFGTNSKQFFFFSVTIGSLIIVFRTTTVLNRRDAADAYGDETRCNVVRLYVARMARLLIRYAFL